MCSAENYSVVGPCTPNFRRLRRGRCRPRRPLFLIWHGFLPTYWDFESMSGGRSAGSHLIQRSRPCKVSNRRRSSARAGETVAQPSSSASCSSAWIPRRRGDDHQSPLLSLLSNRGVVAPLSLREPLEQALPVSEAVSINDNASWTWNLF